MILVIAASSAAIVALIAAVSALITAGVVPIVINHMNAKQRNLERQADWDRQDLVADRAAAAAKSITDRQDEATRTLQVATRYTTKKLSEIHTLVNSDMTAARQAELNQTMLVLSALRRLIERDQSEGKELDPNDVQAIKVAEERIEDLRAILADRLAQQHLVEDEQATAAAEAEAEAK